MTEMVKYARKLADISPFKGMIGGLCFVIVWEVPCTHVSSEKEINPGPETKTDTQLRGKFEFRFVYGRPSHCSFPDRVDQVVCWDHLA